MSDPKAQEVGRLTGIAQESPFAHPVGVRMIRYCHKVFSRHWVPGRILELGPAEGKMTELLIAGGHNVTAVEGAEEFCIDLKKRLPQVEVIHSLFEDFRPKQKFENVILGHVLEHVQDPVAILRLAAEWLAPGGVLLAAVPNARSIHRQAAVMMGLLGAEDELNESDIRHGHRRVFNPESFRNLFKPAGLGIEVFGGYWLKPLANGQLDKDWNAGMLDAFMALGERYPDIAAEIYACARHQGAKP